MSLQKVAEVSVDDAVASIVPDTAEFIHAWDPNFTWSLQTESSDLWMPATTQISHATSNLPSAHMCPKDEAPSQSPVADLKIVVAEHLSDAVAENLSASDRCSEAK
eukprot:2919173-Rhodomonas_salina.1